MSIVVAIKAGVNAPLSRSLRSSKHPKYNMKVLIVFAVAAAANAGVLLSSGNSVQHRSEDVSDFDMSEPCSSTDASTNILVCSEISPVRNVLKILV